MTEKYDVAIVGCGPAGLTAGIYAGRAGKSAVMFEREMTGGQITFTDAIDNFPATPGISGAEYAMKMQSQAEHFGTLMIPEEVLSIDKPSKEGDYFVLKTPENTYRALAVILATGLSHRHMGLDGEDKLIGRGISFCAVCDGAFFRGKDVAVYGGGNTALEDAAFLASICNKVTIIHRRDRFRGEQHLVDELKSKENVIFEMNNNVSAVHGDDVLQSITIKNTETGEEKNINVSGIFVAIGQIPNGRSFANLVSTDEAGYYMIDENCESEVNGVFVAGDGRNKTVRQLTTAVSDGAIAATAACRYVDRINGREYI